MDDLAVLYWQARGGPPQKVGEAQQTADRVRRLRAELKDRYQIEPGPDADEAELGRLLSQARTTAGSAALRAVQEKAERFFFKMQLDEIKTKNALLLYVSVMERQIVLFPDPRLNFSKMPEINQQLLKILQKSFKGGDYEAGILLALGHLKESLGADFAKHSKSENIVPNKLIWWND